jgi:hypothetical protein
MADRRGRYYKIRHVAMHWQLAEEINYSEWSALGWEFVSYGPHVAMMAVSGDTRPCRGGRYLAPNLKTASLLPNPFMHIFSFFTPLTVGA